LRSGFGSASQRLNIAVVLAATIQSCGLRLNTVLLFSHAVDVVLVVLVLAVAVHVVLAVKYCCC
jgi:hypothetical protein